MTDIGREVMLLAQGQAAEVALIAAGCTGARLPELVVDAGARLHRHRAVERAINKALLEHGEKDSALAVAVRGALGAGANPLDPETIARGRQMAAAHFDVAYVHDPRETLFGILLLDPRTLPGPAREYLDSISPDASQDASEAADAERAAAVALWWYRSGRPAPDGFAALVEEACR